MSDAATTNATADAAAQAMNALTLHSPAVAAGLSAVGSATIAEAASTPAAASSSATAPPSRCVLTQQPVTTLALVCRCLDAHSLLSAYQSCRSLKAAASHPLTHQYAIGVRVPRMKPVEIIGPGATFDDPRKFALALQSPLMRPCRNLTLRTSSPAQLLGLLEVLAADSPALHSLSLQLGAAYWLPHTTDVKAAQEGSSSVLDGQWTMWDRKGAVSSVPEGSASSLPSSSIASAPRFIELRRYQTSSPYVLRLFDFAPNPQLQYLRVLRIHCTYDFLLHSPLLHQLPRSLELLQLQLEDAIVQLRVPVDLPDWLQPLPRLRRLVLCGTLGFDRSSLALPLASLQTLSQLCEECPQIDRIDYLPAVDLASLASTLLERTDQQRPSSLRLASVRELRVARLPMMLLANSSSNAQMLQALTLFPSLTALTFDACVKSAVAQREMVLPSWPPQIASQLRELQIRGAAHGSKALIDQLIAARMVALESLEITQGRATLHHPPLVDLAPLLLSMPSLQRLAFTGLRVESLDVFAAAPGLLSLSGLHWPYADAFSALKAHPLEQPPICPLLQSLVVEDADELYPLHCNPLPVLQRLFPALDRVQWRSLPAVSLSKLSRLASAHHFAHLFDSTFHRHPRHIRVGLLSRAETMLAQRRAAHPAEVAHKAMRSVLSVLEQEVDMQLFDAAKHGASADMPFEIDLGPAGATDVHDSSYAAAASSSSASAIAAASPPPPPVVFAFAVGGSSIKKRAGAKHSAASAPAQASVAASLPSAVPPLLHPFTAAAFGSAPNPFAPASEAAASAATAPNPFAAPASGGFEFGSTANPFASSSTAGFAAAFAAPSAVSACATSSFGVAPSPFAFAPTPFDASPPIFTAAANPFAAASTAAAVAAASSNPFAFAPPAVAAPSQSAGPSALAGPFAFGSDR